VCCSVLQCIATVTSSRRDYHQSKNDGVCSLCRNVMLQGGGRGGLESVHDAACCSALQCVAVCCSVLRQRNIHDLIMSFVKMLVCAVCSKKWVEGERAGGSETHIYSRCCSVLHLTKGCCSVCSLCKIGGGVRETHISGCCNVMCCCIGGCCSAL